MNTLEQVTIFSENEQSYNHSEREKIRTELRKVIAKQEKVIRFCKNQISKNIRNNDINL